MVSRLKGFFSNDSDRGLFLRATTLLAGGTAAGQLIALLASPVISRLYSPAEAGTLGTFATVLSCIAPIACLRYEAAIALPKEEERATRLLVLCVLGSLSVALATAVFLAFFGGWLANVCHDPSLVKFLWLMPISLAGVGVYQAFNYWAVRQREFGLAARTKIVQGTVQAGCQVGLGLAKTGTLGLILGDVLGRVSGAGSIAWLAWRQHKAQVLATKLADVKEVAEEYRLFPLVSGPATLLHTATSNFTLVLAPLYGPVVYGFYYFGTRFLWGPVSLVGQAMAQVYLGEASRWAREDPVRLLRAFDQIVRRLALFGLVPFGLLALFGAPLTSLVFGKQWYQAGVLVQIQAVSWWAMFVVGPVLNTLNILQKQSWQLWADTWGVVAMGIGFWASWRNGWSAQVAVGIYSGVIIVMYVWLFLACRRAIVLDL